jgi:predicted transcriptional regulator of viral defense system
MNKSQRRQVKEATCDKLNKLDQPAISKYELAFIIYEQTLSIDNESLSHTEYKKIINSVRIKTLLSNHDNHHAYFYLFGKNKASIYDIICSIEPFCFISHLSAMEYHGLTNRLPKLVFLTSPPPKRWKELAEIRMKKDYKSLETIADNGLPELIRIQPKALSTYTLNWYHSLQQGSFKNIQGSPLRVSTLGQTYLDMVKKPDFCGGIHHVIEVFQEHGKMHLPLILHAVDTHGTQIAKIRVGYILSEICNLKNKTIDKWQEEEVQRGGSRKLDAASEYSSQYSERWCLSINI